MEKLINSSETTIEEQSGGHSLGSRPNEEMETSSVEYSILELPMTRQRAKITKTVGIQEKQAECTSTNTRQKKTLFTREEDSFLLKGLQKHGKSKWTHILKDPEYKFHPSRKSCTLMMRAKSKNYI